MQLKQLRTSQKMLQKDVAALLGIDRTTYAKYESGASEPNYETLLKLAEIFGVSTDYILGRDEKKPAAEDGSGLVVYEKLAKMLLDQGIDVGTLSDAQLQRLAKIIAAALEQ
ncbi:helix-turn-helix domain-containing protein [Pseudoflavonifractor sp. CLA-AP-H29]|uniref:Helix-turn-helix domain-containing protein n=1 Tax=Pseudoflavonifractor intestinihominis TaxID=3133171 RepID=A0ABV1EB86_9FIRM